MVQTLVLSLRQSELDCCSSQKLAEIEPLSVPSFRQRLCFLRAELGRAEAVKAANGGINTSIFDFLVAFEIQTLPDLIEKPERYTWLNDYRHKSLIHLSMCAYATYNRSPVTSKYPTYTTVEIIRFMNEVVARTHPEIASTLQSSMVEVS